MAQPPDPASEHAPESSGIAPLAPPDKSIPPEEVLPKHLEPIGAGRLIRSSSIVGIGTLTSRITGLLRTMVIAIVLGAHTLADGYNLANTTPNMIYDLLIGGVFSATLIPIFVEHHHRKDPEGNNAVVTVLMTVAISITILSLIFARQIFEVYTWNISDPGDRAEIISVGVPMLRWFLPQIVFYAFTAIAKGLLNAHRSYLVPAFVPALNNLVAVCMFGAFWRVGGVAPSASKVVNDPVLMLLLGGGTTAGIAVMAIGMLPALNRAGIHLRPSFHWRHPSIRRVSSLSSWMVAYTVGNQIVLAVVLSLAASVKGSGFVTAYAYAFMFYQLPYGLFATSLITTVEPELAIASARGDDDGFRRQFSSGLRLLLVGLIPSAFGLGMLAHPIVNTLLGHGGYRQNAGLTGSLLAIFAAGLIGYSVYMYTMRCFYALQDTRTPFMVNVVVNVVNLALAFAFVDNWGVKGLVAAYSISYTLAALGALWAVWRRVGHYDIAGIWHTASRVVAASVVMAAALFVVTELLGSGLGFASIPTVIVGVLVGGLVFAVAALPLRVRELDRLVETLRARRNR